MTDGLTEGPRRRPWLGIAALVTVALAFVAVTWVGRNVPVRVPNVVGLERDDAVLRIRDAGFRVGSETQVPVRRGGLVVTQTPDPGVRLKPGSRVDIGIGATIDRDPVLPKYLEPSSGTAPSIPPASLAAARKLAVSMLGQIDLSPVEARGWLDSGSSLTISPVEHGVFDFTGPGVTGVNVEVERAWGSSQVKRRGSGSYFPRSAGHAAIVVKSAEVPEYVLSEAAATIKRPIDSLCLPDETSGPDPYTHVGGRDPREWLEASATATFSGWRAEWVVRWSEPSRYFQVVVDARGGLGESDASFDHLR